MNEQKFSKFKSFLAWLRQHLRLVIILGMLIACVAILMSRGEGFLRAVQDSYILVSYFLSYNRGHTSDDSLAILGTVIILLVLMGIIIYSLVGGKPKK